MNYQQTLEYLYSQLPMFQRIGPAAYKADLGNTIAIAELLGHPERNFRSVHVAGTNGKGSVSHMLASILQESGYKTGLYTSPHLKDFRERIKVNGKMVPENFVIQFVEKNKNSFEVINPSFFEYTAGMAFDYFNKQQVDIAILETGMGGRLDSTNVIHPILSVITNISLDHTTFLGDTLKKIATEKAGIIKDGVPVIVGEYQEEVAPVFASEAKKHNSPLHFADKTYNAIKSSRQGYDTYDSQWNIRFEGKSGTEGLFCPLKGDYQANNISTVLKIVDELIKHGFTITRNSVHSGLSDVVQNTGILGRWQVLKNSPKVICDIGHNEAGIRSIVDQLDKQDFNHLHWVFGMVNDKDSAKVLGMLPDSASYYFCRPDIPRGKDAEELKKEAKKYGLQGDTYPSVKEAYRTALSRAGENDLVFIGGSTFVVAEVI